MHLFHIDAEYCDLKESTDDACQTRMCKFLFSGASSFFQLFCLFLEGGGLNLHVFFYFQTIFGLFTSISCCFHRFLFFCMWPLTSLVLYHITTQFYEPWILPLKTSNIKWHNFKWQNESVSIFLESGRSCHKKHPCSTLLRKQQVLFHIFVVMTANSNNIVQTSRNA